MATKELQSVVFGSKEAAAMVKELRESYGSGKTRSYEWRVSQLKNIEKMTEYHEQEIIEALRSDLSKPEFESYIQEVPNFQLHLNLSCSCAQYMYLCSKHKNYMTV